MGSSVKYFPNSNQNKNVITANPITDGTKIPAILSASFCTGAFDPCASSTNLIIFAKTVFWPNRVTFILKNPVLFILAPKTSSPTFFSKGRLSPVNIDSSIDELPSKIFPSTGICSPGLTQTRSPTVSSEILTSNSSPCRSIFAVRGCNCISFLIAFEALRLARDSIHRPNRTKAIIITEVSKYTSTFSSAMRIHAGKNVATVL